MAQGGYTADPISNALTSPEANRFFRQILEAALENQPDPPADWVPGAQALLANLIMNNALNSWNESEDRDLDAAQYLVNQAMAAKPPDSVLALANHAQGLIHRANGKQDDAQQAFEIAVQLDPGFARAYAQIANQEILRGNAKNAIEYIDEVINRNPYHAASGAFHWVRGRAFVEQGLWQDAITALDNSLLTRETVWYPYAYKAYALLQNQQVKEAQDTLTGLSNDPRFQDKLSQLKSSPEEDPARPGAKVRNLLREWLSTGILPQP